MELSKKVLDWYERAEPLYIPPVMLDDVLADAGIRTFSQPEIKWLESRVVHGGFFCRVCYMCGIKTTKFFARNLGERIPVLLLLSALFWFGTVVADPDGNGLKTTGAFVACMFSAAIFLIWCGETAEKLKDLVLEFPKWERVKIDHNEEFFVVRGFNNTERKVVIPKSVLELNRRVHELDHSVTLYARYHGNDPFIEVEKSDHSGAVDVVTIEHWD